MASAARQQIIGGGAPIIIMALGVR